ncbi:NTP transferase domain-containing protein, partial [Candidatus Bipolaricaulota bacterium]|nr:NTP transferase domain-containing protein [Candidatus Bipolaricaulota bacterium]
MASETSMTEKATLILLAGGKSKRMGQPKHLLLTSQGTLIEQLDLCLRHLFSETLVVGRDLA